MHISIFCAGAGSFLSWFTMTSQSHLQWSCEAECQQADCLGKHVWVQGEDCLPCTANQSWIISSACPNPGFQFRLATLTNWLLFPVLAVGLSKLKVLMRKFLFSSLILPLPVKFSLQGTEVLSPLLRSKCIGEYLALHLKAHATFALSLPLSSFLEVDGNLWGSSSIHRGACHLSLTKFMLTFSRKLKCFGNPLLCKISEF